MSETMSSETAVVPDSIEPYVGFKYLNVDATGLLISPHGGMTWQPMHRAAAECHAARWGWQLTSGVPHAPTSISCMGSHLMFGDMKPPPLIEPPAGKSWSWEPIPCPDLAGNSCSCGIYAVDTPEHARGYYRDDRLLVEIAIWGKTTIGDQGARGQYAYPKCIYATKPMRPLAEKAAALYGVPFVMEKDIGKDVVSEMMRDLTPERKPRLPFIAWANLGTVVMNVTLISYFNPWSILSAIGIGANSVVAYQYWIRRRQA